MEGKDGDRNSSVLGASDTKSSQPPSSVKNEVCLETWFVAAVATLSQLLCTLYHGHFDLLNILPFIINCIAKNCMQELHFYHATLCVARS